MIYVSLQPWSLLVPVRTSVVRTSPCQGNGESETLFSPVPHLEVDVGRRLGRGLGND